MSPGRNKRGKVRVPVIPAAKTSAAERLNRPAAGGVRFSSKLANGVCSRGLFQECAENVDNAYQHSTTAYGAHIAARRYDELAVKTEHGVSQRNEG